jgi:anti-anti-sigma factor
MSLSRADLHIHTTYSDGLLEPEDAVNYAVTRTTLRLIAITDHNTLDGARHAYEYWQHHREAFGQIEVVIGEEISAQEGHILGLFLHEPVPPHLPALDTIQAIHEQGGLAIAAHPFTHLLRFTGLIGIGRRIAELPLDGVEVRNAAPTELYANLVTEAFNAHHRRHTPLGGSDTHYLPMMGRTYTLFDGSSPDDLRAAICSGTARAGGIVVGPLTVARFVRDQIHRHRLPLVRPDDHHYRYAAPELTVDVQELHQAGTAVLRCGGSIVRHNAGVFRADLVGLLKGGLTRLVLDLEDVPTVDSAGLGAVLYAQKLAQTHGGTVALCSPPPRITRALKLQHVQGVLPVYATVNDALQALESTAHQHGETAESREQQVADDPLSQ